MIRCALGRGIDMKVCSICNRQYADSLKFCLDDGTVLTAAPEPDATLIDPQATLRLHARETDARPATVKQGRPLAWLGVAVVSIIVVISVIGVAALLLINSASKSSTTSNVANSAKPPESSPAKATTSTVSVAEEVERTNNEVGAALIKGDTDALARLLADDYRYVSDVGLTLNKMEVLLLMRTGNLSYEYLTTTEPKVEVNSESSRAELTAHAKAKGQLRRQPFTDSYFYRNTYEKRNGVWQLVSGTVWHRQ